MKGIPGEISNGISEGIPGRVSEYNPERLSEGTPRKISKITLRETPSGTSGDIPERGIFKKGNHKSDLFSYLRKNSLNKPGRNFEHLEKYQKEL